MPIMASKELKKTRCASTERTRNVTRQRSRCVRKSHSAKERRSSSCSSGTLLRSPSVSSCVAGNHKQGSRATHHYSHEQREAPIYLTAPIESRARISSSPLPAPHSSINSSQLELYIALCKRMDERMERDNSWPWERDSQKTKREVQSADKLT